MDRLPGKKDWNVSEEVVKELERAEEEFKDRQKQLLEDGEIDLVEYGRLLPQGFKLADKVMGALDPEFTGEDPEELSLIDLGSGLGTYAAIAASMGIGSVGIERERHLHKKAQRLSENVDSESLQGRLDYVQGDFYRDGTWEQIDIELEDFSIVVTYLPGDQMDEALEFLRENGPEDGVYVFPELGGSKEVDGFEPSELNSYYEEPLRDLIYNQASD